MFARGGIDTRVKNGKIKERVLFFCRIALLLHVFQREEEGEPKNGKECKR